MRIAKKTLWKILLDICMLSLLVLMYQKRVISMRFHEVGGLMQISPERCEDFASDGVSISV